MNNDGSGRAYSEKMKDSSVFDNCIWMSTSEAADYLRTSSQQIRNWVYQGRLKGYKLGRKLLFKRTDLNNALVAVGGW